MDVPAIFGLQFILSTLVWGLVARWWLSPWLEKQSHPQALSWLILPHAFRHIGLVFLVPGVVANTLAEDFARPAAYGDLISGLLAFVALLALRNGWPGAMAITWTFNLFGTLDLLNALRHLDVAPHFGAAWYIPTFLVPLLLVTHFMVFVRLIKGGNPRRDS